MNWRLFIISWIVSFFVFLWLLSCSSLRGSSGLEVEERTAPYLCEGFSSNAPVPTQVLEGMQKVCWEYYHGDCLKRAIWRSQNNWWAICSRDTTAKSGWNL